jgi:hypothetical protein
LPQYDIRAAARDRDHGMHRVNAVTWRVGAAGVALAGLLALAFGHHPAASTSTGTSTSTSTGTSSGMTAGKGAAKSTGKSTGTTKHSHNSGGGIVIPAQPPKSASGSGQAVSGAS